VRHSYRFDEVQWGARFVPAFEPDAQGEMVLDLDKLSRITPAIEAENLPAGKLAGETSDTPALVHGAQTKES
jgi:hypothetical protein